MTPRRANGAIQADLRELVSLGVLDYSQMQKIAERYPTTRWDLIALVRWFTVLGAMTTAAGAVMLMPRLFDVQNLVDIGLAIAAVGGVAIGLWLERRRQMPRTGSAVQLLGSFALQGLVVALAIRFSTGSDNWPGLVGICAVLTGALAYALPNRLILIQALANAFTFFGGETGYVSGWGAYWLGMDYPSRFIAAGLASIALAVEHARLLRGVRQGFARVYAHYGFLVLNLALWFFALFGFFDGHDYFSWDGREGQRVVWSAVWAALSLGSFYAGARMNLRLVRGYGMTFLVINAYTFYFQFVVVPSAELWFLHLLIAGTSMVGLGVWLERRMSARRKAEREAG
jgi:hypothetical protein